MCRTELKGQMFKIIADYYTVLYFPSPLKTDVAFYFNEFEPP